MTEDYSILDRFVKFNTYARFRQVSYTAVTQWAKQGKVEMRMIDGTQYIVLSDEEREEFKAWREDC